MVDDSFHGTTIVCVRRGSQVAMGGDGQVTLGNVVVKASARKVAAASTTTASSPDSQAPRPTRSRCSSASRRSSTSDQANFLRSAVELAKDWRTDRMLRRLEAMLAVADREASFSSPAMVTSSSRSDGIVAMGSGGPFAQAAAMALLEHTELSPGRHRQAIAADRKAISASTPTRTTWWRRSERHGRPSMSASAAIPDPPAASMMTPQEIVHRARQAHRRPGRGQEGRGHRAAQSLETLPGGRAASPRGCHAEEHPDDRDPRAWARRRSRGDWHVSPTRPS